MFKVVLGQRGDMARSGRTSWDRGEIEGNKHHIGDNLECSRQSDK